MAPHHRDDTVGQEAYGLHQRLVIPSARFRTV